MLAPALLNACAKLQNQHTGGHTEQIDGLLDDFMRTVTEHGMQPQKTVLADWKTRFTVNGQLMRFHSPGY